MCDVKPGAECKRATADQGRNALAGLQSGGLPSCRRPGRLAPAPARAESSGDEFVPLVVAGPHTRLRGLLRRPGRTYIVEFTSEPAAGVMARVPRAERVRMGDRRRGEIRAEQREIQISASWWPWGGKTGLPPVLSCRMDRPRGLSYSPAQTSASKRCAVWKPVRW